MIYLEALRPNFHDLMLLVILRVPGRPPILSAFRQKFHQSSGSYRFYFKYADASWVEITENNEPLPVIDEIVEARVMDVLS